MLKNNKEAMNMSENLGNIMTEERIITQAPTPSAPAAMPEQLTIDEQFVAKLERYPDVRKGLTKEQISAREQRRTELEETFSYNDYKGIRMEMHASHYDPSVVIRERSITFNQPCVGSLEGVSYIQMYFSESLGRLAIRPVSKNTPHALHWCTESKGRRKSRSVTCPDLTKLFRDIMGWSLGIRYKVLGYLIEVDGEQIYVFDFKYAKMYNDRRFDAEGKRIPADRKGHYPKEVTDELTMPVNEFEKSMVAEAPDSIISDDMLIGPEKLESRPGTTEAAQKPENAPAQANESQQPIDTVMKPEEEQAAVVRPYVQERNSFQNHFYSENARVARPTNGNPYML